MAFDVADSIAKSITLQQNEEAKDLASAYKALSYVAYGLNYGAFPLMGQQGINPIEYNTKTTACIVDKANKTSTFSKELHSIELQSDQGFALFFENPNTGDSIIVSAKNYLESIYKEDSKAFQTFQLNNRTYFFAYCQAIVHLTNGDDVEMVTNKIRKIADQLDSFPKNVTTDEEYYDVFNKIIGVRAEMINILAMDLEHNKRVWPQQN